MTRSNCFVCGKGPNAPATVRYSPLAPPESMLCPRCGKVRYDVYSIHTGAVLVFIGKALAKWFPTWFDEESGTAWVRVGFVEAEFQKRKGQELPMVSCSEFVLKHWKGFDPKRHRLAMSAGHFHRKYGFAI